MAEFLKAPHRPTTMVPFVVKRCLFGLLIFCLVAHQLLQSSFHFPFKASFASAFLKEWDKNHSQNNHLLTNYHHEKIPMVESVHVQRTTTDSLTASAGSSSAESGSARGQEATLENYYDSQILLHPSTKRHYCQRSCSNQRRNKIVIAPHPKYKAGLNDRLTILNQLGNLAGYLCATMVLPAPRLFLSPIHNHNKTLSSQVTWDDFVSMSWHHHNTNTYNNTNQGKSSLTSSSSSSSLPVYSSIYHFKQSRWIIHQGYPNTSLILYSQHIKQVWNHFRQVESWTFDSNTHQEPFVWYVAAEFYHFANDFAKRVIRPPMVVETNLLQSHQQQQQRQQLHENGRTNISTMVNTTEPYHYGMRPSILIQSSLDQYNKKLWLQPCSYLQSKTPATTNQIVTFLWKAIQQKQQAFLATTKTETSSSSSYGNPNTTHTTNNSTVPTKETTTLIGLFHIRRNDAQKECDTSIVRMQQYLNCSFQQIEQWMGEGNTKNILLLVASDEHDPDYRLSLLQYMRQQLHIQAVDFDLFLQQQFDLAVQKKLLPSRLATDNNFYLFQVEQTLRWQYLDFALEQRRSISCHDCDKLIQMPKVKQKLHIV